MKEKAIPKVAVLISTILVITTGICSPANGVTRSVTQITDNSYTDGRPQISDANVVWRGYDGSDYEIFFWNGSTTTNVSDNSYVDNDPYISGDNVAWRGYDSSNSEIFYWDGSTTVQVTIRLYDDANPQISGSVVVWEGDDDTDYEIFVSPCTLLSSDANGDCKVDFTDFAIMALHWLECTLVPPEKCWE